MHRLEVKPTASSRDSIKGRCKSTCFYKTR